MRNTNCRNIRREIEEAGSADLLSAAAISHLETCAACEKLSRQQTGLQAMLAGLGAVEAPGDFDFRLRARLAGEKHGAAQSPPWANLSFGFRSAAVAAILLIASVFAFVALKPGANNSLAGAPQTAPAAGTSGSLAKQDNSPHNVVPNSDELATVPKHDESSTIQASVPPSEHVLKGLEGSRGVATVRGGGTLATLEQTQKRAPVLTRDQLAESYPTAAFPINASYQSLKVSVDDARGTSRTISLPSVSFGSQRTLSQSASPLLASSTSGTW
ncbi:MAG: hypothetical protein ABJC10_00325 [Acidobacteriota bacterium]